MNRGTCPWGCRESDTTEQLSLHFSSMVDINVSYVNTGNIEYFLILQVHPSECSMKEKKREEKRKGDRKEE